MAMLPSNASVSAAAGNAVTSREAWPSKGASTLKPGTLRTRCLCESHSFCGIKGLHSISQPLGGSRNRSGVYLVHRKSPPTVVLASAPLTKQNFVTSLSSASNPKEKWRDLKSGLQFLCEQPGELKFIEFPSLQSAVKLALFTLVVVVVLIVFLATIDSLFSYILAMILRRAR